MFVCTYDEPGSYPPMIQYWKKFSSRESCAIRYRCGWGKRSIRCPASRFCAMIFTLQLHSSVPGSPSERAKLKGPRCHICLAVDFDSDMLSVFFSAWVLVPSSRPLLYTGI